MKKLLLPVLGLAILGLSAPVASACPWNQEQTTEKPKEKVENPST